MGTEIFLGQYKHVFVVEAAGRAPGTPSSRPASGSSWQMRVVAERLPEPRNKGRAPRVGQQRLRFQG